MTLCAKKSFEINATDLEGFSEDGGHTRAVVLCVGSLWSCCSSLCWGGRHLVSGGIEPFFVGRFSIKAMGQNSPW